MEITFLELKTVLTKWIGSLQDSRFTVYLYPAVIFVDRSLLARLLGCVWFARSGSGFQAFGFFGLFRPFRPFGAKRWFLYQLFDSIWDFVISIMHDRTELSPFLLKK